MCITFDKSINTNVDEGLVVECVPSTKEVLGLILSTGKEGWKGEKMDQEGKRKVIKSFALFRTSQGRSQQLRRL